MSSPPKRQRVAAYAVIIRDRDILLSRLAPKVTSEELWTLPGGGLNHGEDPRDAVLREIREETGLEAEVSDLARVYSSHLPTAWRNGERVNAHAVRIVYDGWVAKDAPDPRVVEVDGSTVEAAWLPLAGIEDGSVPVVSLVREALEDYRPHRRQRLAAYGLVERDGRVLLTRISPLGYGSGLWTLPGGGVDHAESPRDAVVREIREECGLEATVGALLEVHDLAFAGTAPSGRYEDFHAVHVVYRASVPDGVEPHVVEVDGTTDAVAWVAPADVEDGSLPVTDVVKAALAAR